MDSSAFVELFRSDPDYRRWFRKWWKADFSVNGRGSRTAPSLPSGLAPTTTEFANRTWLSARLPPHDLAGNECSEFNQRPQIRLGTYTSQVLHDRSPPLELCGLFLGNADIRGGSNQICFTHCFIEALSVQSSGRPYTVNVESCFIRNDLSLHNSANLSLQFTHTIVKAQLTLKNIQTIGLTSISSEFFDNISLSGNISRLHLQRTKSKGLNVVKPNSIFDVNLDDSIFTGDVHLRGPISGNTSFKRMTVHGGLQISPGSSPISLTKCHIHENLTLLRAYEGLRVDAIDCTAIGSTRITGNSMQVHLSHHTSAAILCEDVAIDSISITDKSNVGHVKICQASMRELYVIASDVSERLSVISSTIDTALLIEDSVVGGPTDLRATNFLGPLRLERTKFCGGVDLGVLPVTPQLARVNEKTIPALTLSSSYLGHEGAGTYALDLAGRTVSGRLDLSSTSIVGPVRVDRDAFKSQIIHRGAKFDLDLPTLSSSAHLATILGNRSGEWNAEKEAVASAAHELERGFSALKDAMKNAGDIRGERRFHVLELRARRRRGDIEVGRAETVLSYAYDIFSEYGESISRPIWLTLITLAISSTMYFILSGTYTISSTFFAVDFAIQQILRPFSAGATLQGPRIDDYGAIWLRTLLEPPTYLPPGVWTFYVKAVAAIESTVAIAAAFLLALAIRRRFQIS